jgi:hypothetical protein
MRSAIYLEDREKIQKLQDDFRRLKEEFDRAVDVEVLKNARELGNCRHFLRVTYPTNAQTWRRSQVQSPRTVEPG